MEKRKPHYDLKKLKKLFSREATRVITVTAQKGAAALGYMDEDGDVVKGDDVVALISNTCDMQPARQDFIIASPIVSFDELEGDAAAIESLRADIRRNKIFRYFYLPAQNDFPESFIDFSKMVSISSPFLNGIKQNSPQQCILSLSQNGFYFFLIKLTFHLARMEKPSLN